LITLAAVIETNTVPIIRCPKCQTYTHPLGIETPKNQQSPPTPPPTPPHRT
jgi:hypothetical protein